MTHRVGCELSGVFAAIAPVAGALNTDTCRPDHPVSVVLFHGTADQHIRYDGGPPRKAVDLRHARVDKPVAYAVTWWAKHNQCRPERCSDDRDLRDRLDVGFLRPTSEAMTAGRTGRCPCGSARKDAEAG
jgi:poly(3-hydroxybutyrate) depolymerase